MNGNYIVPPLRLVFFMWLIFTIQLYNPIDFGVFGVFPRTLFGLIGILTAPLIHGNTTHLLSNTFPVLFLGSTIYLFYARIAGQVFLICYFMPSIFVWLFGRPFYHIGASGLVYALALFLISMGLFRRNAKSVIISIIVILIYGGLLFNLTMLRDEISWESHVFGSVVGIGIAYGIHKTGKQ